MRIIDGQRAWSNLLSNKYGHWNNIVGADKPSPRKNDASNRIFDGAADVRAKFSRAKLKRSDPVFAMGSCFAREVEARLMQIGGTVCSVDPTLQTDIFAAPDGRPNAGVLHRYTPQSMLQEFRAAFGEQPGWDHDALIFERTGMLARLAGRNARVDDANYVALAYRDATLDACLARRRTVQTLVRRVTEARTVILTLGLNEAWLHKPSGLYANAVPARILAAQRDSLELHVADAKEVEAILEAIYALLHAKLQPGFDLVITVSPVPLGATFQAADVIIANMEAKSTLRSAAGAFASGKKDVHYFPSYEMALYSDPSLAWRPDKLHVTSKLVRRIVDVFTDTFYEPGSFPERGRRNEGVTPP